MAGQTTLSQPTNEPAQAERVRGSDHPINQRLLTYIGIAVSAIGVASFLICLFRTSYNFPYFDDFEVILAFLNEFLTTHQFTGKFQLLVQQHSEHRVVFTRLVALAEYWVTGTVNFRSLILIAHAALIGILIISYKSVQRTGRQGLLGVAPVALLLFNFRYFEASFWAMTALQSLWVLFFVFSSLYFLFSPNGRGLVFAIACAVMATFTSANGMAVFFAGLIVLALNRQLFSRKALVWSGAGIAAIAAYFFHYVKPAQHPSVIQPLLNDPLAFAGYILAFLGGMFTENVAVAIIIGCLLVGLACYLTFRRCFRENPVSYSLIVFLLMTAVLAGLTRFGFGIEQALASRYTIFSTLLVVSCYLTLLPIVQRQMKTGWWLAILTLSLCFHYNTYAKYLPAKLEEKANYEKDSARIALGKLSHFNFGWPPLDPRREFPRQELRKADALGYFSFKFKDEGEMLTSLRSDPSKRSEYHFDRFQQVGPVLLFLSGWAVIHGVDSNDVIPVACFKDEQGNVAKYMVLQQAARPDIAKRYSGDRADHVLSGFETVFTRAEIKPGNYTLTLFLAAPDFKVEIDAGPTMLGR